MDEMSKPKGSGPWYAASAVAVGVSVDTSWRFFGTDLHITDLRERVILFAVLEVALLAAGWSMRAGVRRDGSPGSARWIAWALCGMSAYMAIQLSGPMEGVARVLLGPVLALVALHQALGIEVKARIGARAGTWARIGREMRERALSRLGLADDQRDALQRTRERAAVRAATLATSRKPPRAALRRAVLKSGAATDPAMRTLLLDTRAALGSVDKLLDEVADNPWTSPVQPAPVPSAPRPARPRVSPTSGGPAPSWDADKVVAMMLKGEDVSGLISDKTAQRVRRILNALAADTVTEDFARGGITVTLINTVRAARLKAMEV